MSVVEDFRASGPRLRIAVPAWRLGRQGRAIEPVVVTTAASRAEFQSLMDDVSGPRELIHMRLTKSERRQRSISRKVRDALYSTDLP